MAVADEVDGDVEFFVELEDAAGEVPAGGEPGDVRVGAGPLEGNAVAAAVEMTGETAADSGFGAGPPCAPGGRAVNDDEHESGSRGAGLHERERIPKGGGMLKQ